MKELINTCELQSNVVWGQVYPIMQWFAISTFPWQHLDQFLNFSFAKVEEGKKIPFFNTKKCYIC